MDTSNGWKIVEQLRGTNKIPLADIPVEAWLEIIDGLYRDPIAVQVPNLFTTMAEMMEQPVVQKFNLERGQTAFDRGIGINTSVCGFQLSLVAKMQMKALLLLRPEQKLPLKWAVWRIAPFPGQSSRPLQSYVYWADEKEVLEIFSQYPHVGCNVIDRLHLMTRQYAELLRKTTESVEAISLRASEIYWRIKR